VPCSFMHAHFLLGAGRLASNTAACLAAWQCNPSCRVPSLLHLPRAFCFASALGVLLAQPAVHVVLMSGSRNSFHVSSQRQSIQLQSTGSAHTTPRSAVKWLSHLHLHAIARQCCSDLGTIEHGCITHGCNVHVHQTVQKGRGSITISNSSCTMPMLIISRTKKYTLLRMEARCGSGFGLLIHAVSAAAAKPCGGQLIACR